MKRLYIAKAADDQSVIALAESPENLRSRIKGLLPGPIVTIREMDTFAICLSEWEGQIVADLFDSDTQLELTSHEYQGWGSFMLRN